MNNLKQLLNKIPELNGGKLSSDESEYTLELEDSDRYGYIYSVLDKELKDSDLSNVEDDFILNIFEYENLEVRLIADFNKDIYKVVIREV